MMSNIQSFAHVSGCKRCGTCCKKGGPSFHLEDKELIEEGIISSKFLYTIRKGEIAFDNVKERLVPVTSDIIKIKGIKNSWTCTFFDEKENGCSIYENRPIECRALKCWDTREIEQIYSKNRLTRKDLLSEIKGLWSLIEDHQSRCSYEKIKRFVDDLNGDKKDAAVEGINDIIQYDTHLRPLVVKKGSIDPDMLDFLFGRPLTETIKMFNIKQVGGKFCPL